MQEVPRPQGKDKAKALKKKGVSKSGSSANDEALAKMMISEMAQQTERDNELKRKERAEWMAIKRKEVEVNEYKSKQQDLMFYMQPYEHLTGEARKAVDEVRAGMKAKWGFNF